MQCWSHDGLVRRVWEERAITVAALIAYLQTLPQDYEVACESDEYAFRVPFSQDDGLEVVHAGRLVLI